MDISEKGGIMKKRVVLLLLTLTLFLSGINVQATEKKNTNAVNKYVNFILNEVKGTKNEESISSLKDSMEQFIKNEKPEDVKKILNFISEKIGEGKWKSNDGIKEIIAEGEKEFDVTLTKEQKDKIISVINKVKKVGISPEYLLEQVEELYEKYGEKLTEEIEQEKDKIVEETQSKIKEEVNKSVSNYFSDMVNNVKSFFKGILKNK